MMRPIGGRFVFLLLLALAVTSPLLLRAQDEESQSEGTPKIQELDVAEKIVFSSGAPAAILPAIKCDLNGDIYAVYSESLEPILADSPYADPIERMPVQEIVPGEKTHIPFGLPTIADYPYLLRVDFDVDPHGRFYALIAAFNGPRGRKDRKTLGSLIVRYEDDGTMDSYIVLDPFAEGEISPTRFAALPDGTFLVIGTIWKPEGVHQFTALFDRSGKFVTYVKIPGDVSLKEVTAPRPPPPKEKTPKDEAQDGTSKPQSKIVPENASQRKQDDGGRASMEAVNGSKLLSAPDGNVYLMRGTDPLRLYAISPGGEIVHQYSVPRPAPDLEPVQMGLAGIGSLFIRFDHIGGQEPGTEARTGPLITVVDLSTGKVSAVYRTDPSAKDFGVGACSSSPYDFLFVGGSKDRKLEVLRYSAR